MPRKFNKQKKLHVKKGDRVRVISGNFKGSEGRVLRVFLQKERVIVEGVNLRLRHTKPSPANPQGGRFEREMPIHASNVQPLDGNGDPTRIGRKRIEDPETGRGRWIRFAKTTDEELDR
jgi:large subunit ribosomal protein L24